MYGYVRFKSRYRVFKGAKLLYLRYSCFLFAYHRQIFNCHETVKKSKTSKSQYLKFFKNI